MALVVRRIRLSICLVGFHRIYGPYQKTKPQATICLLPVQMLTICVRDIVEVRWWTK